MWPAHPIHFLLSSFSRPTALSLLDLPELITVTQDQVHVLVKGFEGPDEDAAVLQDAPHPVVNVLQHLAALAHRHGGGSDGSDSRRILCHRGLVASQPAAGFPPPPLTEMLPAKCRR